MTTLIDPQSVLASKRAARAAAIDKLMAEARSRGSIVDRAFWSMVYDFERAPSTTNRRQLAEIGVEVPPPSTLDDNALPTALATVIGGLALLHIYLLHTNHLTDRQLYERLEKEVLEEEVRDAAGTTGVHEWIDLSDMEDQVDFSRFYDEDKQPRTFAQFPSNRDDTLPQPPNAQPPDRQP